jgi:hypothetical protein
LGTLAILAEHSDRVISGEDILMSIVSGFKFHSGEAHFVTLKGTKTSPVLVTHETVPFPKGQSPEEFVDWATTQLELILMREKPERIVYKLTGGLEKHSQIFGVYFGLAILNLIAFRTGIEIRHRAPNSIRPKAFGLSKEDSVDDFIKDLFGTQESPWNANIREAASIALLELK